MHFKGEYWIIENMCLKIWYMPLKPAIDIHMRDVSFCQATNWVDTTYLHLHTYFHNPPKKRVWIVDPWHVQQVEPQTLIIEKNNYGKTGQSARAPWFHRKNQFWKKKVRITSGIFWTLVGKNPIMEKSDAGAACLSWTCFFSIILSVAIIKMDKHTNTGMHMSYVYI